MFRTYSCCWGTKCTDPHLFHNAMDVSLIWWITLPMKFLAVFFLIFVGFSRPFLSLEGLSNMFIFDIVWNTFPFSGMSHWVIKFGILICCNMVHLFAGLLVNSLILYPVLSKQLDIEWVSCSADYMRNESDLLESFF